MDESESAQENSFGKFLLDSGVLTRADMEEATQSMVLFGGRLGTSLVEAGILTLRALDEQLARYHGLDVAPEEWFARPDPAARAVIPRDLVHKHSAFPLSFEKRTLHIGMLDPTDAAALDDIAFASGCLIVPYALPECRFVELLQKGFGVAPSVRFANLNREAETSRQMREKTAPSEAVTSISDMTVDPVASDMEAVDLVDEVAFEAMHEQHVARNSSPGSPLGTPPAHDDAAWEMPEELAERSEPSADTEAPQAAAEPVQPEPEAPRPAPLDVAGLEQVLLTTLQREDVIRAALRVASAYVEMAALFVVRNELASGTSGWRDGDWFDLETVMVPAVTGCFLADAVNEKRMFRAVPETQLDRRIAKALGRENAAELVAFPILLSGRVVNVLVVDAGTERLSQTGMAALAHLAPMVSNAYERLIRSRKELAG